MFAKLSIRAKITAVVAFLLLALAGMGLLAVMKMRAIDASTVEISTTWLPSVRALSELRAGAITYRNVMREHLLAQTTEEKQAVEKRLADVVANNNEIRRRYEPLMTSPQERALYDQWAQSWEQYKKGTEEVMALSRKAVGQIPREAHELNTNTVNKISLAADDILKQDIALNNSGADAAAKDAADTYASAFLMLTAILGFEI